MEGDAQQNGYTYSSLPGIDLLFPTIAMPSRVFEPLDNVVGIVCARSGVCGGLS